MKKFSLLLSVFVILFACKTKKEEVTQKENKEETKIRQGESIDLKTVQGNFDVYFVEGIELGKISPTLNITKGKVSGFGGCNTFRGALLPNDKNIFTPMGSTRMFCQGKGSEVENIFFKHLSGVNSVTKHGETYNLYQDYKIVVKLKPHVQAAKVSDGSWKVIFVKGYGSIKEEGNPTMLMKGNKISGNTGCNSYFGTVNQKDMKISFSDLGQTEMACEDDKMKLEGKFNQHLQKIDRFVLRGNTMEFYSFGKLLIRAIDEE